MGLYKEVLPLFEKAEAELEETKRHLKEADEALAEAAMQVEFIREELRSSCKSGKED